MCYAILYVFADVGRFEIVHYWLAIRAKGYAMLFISDRLSSTRSSTSASPRFQDDRQQVGIRSQDQILVDQDDNRHAIEGIGKNKR